MASRPAKVSASVSFGFPPSKQMHSNLASQAAILNLNEFLNDILINFDPIFCVILSPIYAHFIYPSIDRLCFCFTLNRRICLGFLSVALAMLVSTIIQHYIYATNSCGSYVNSCTSLDAATEKLPVWIQVPVYFLLANSKVLAIVSGQHAFD